MRQITLVRPAPTVIVGASPVKSPITIRSGGSSTTPKIDYSSGHR